MTNTATFEKLLGNNLSGRSFADVLTLSSHWRYVEDFSLANFLDQIGFEAKATGTEKSFYIENTGHSAAALYDMFILSHKADVSLKEVISNLNCGREEFGNVMAYTHALIAAKLILAYLGIFILNSHGLNFICDFAPGFGDRKQLKRYREAKKTFDNPIKIIILGKKDVTHSSVWSILRTLARKKSISDDDSLNKWLSSFEYDREQIIRNGLLYDSSYWPTDASRTMNLIRPEATNFLEHIYNIQSKEQTNCFFDYILAHKCQKFLSNFRAKSKRLDEMIHI